FLHLHFHENIYMKKIWIFIVAALSFYACKNNDKKSTEPGLSQEERDKAIKDTSNFTSIAWPDSTYHDFGKVKEGEVLEVSFRFINTGDKNLIISDVRPGCGCTDGQKPDEPIAPGKEGVIKAKFNSKGQHIGEAHKNITVTANTKPSQTTELTFKAEVTN
ncbi:MAG: DUF1573 domain-containing protein, partial [Chitinophagaceae bacterium]